VASHRKRHGLGTWLATANARARGGNGSRGNFRVSIFALGQEIPELCGLSSIWARITRANNLDYAKLSQGEIDVVSRLMAQAGKHLRCIATT
jgi:hypothetical protein